MYIIQWDLKNMQIIELFGVIVMLLVSILKCKTKARDYIASKPYPVRFIVWFGLFVIVLLMGTYGIGYDSSQFIYNQF